MTKKNPSTAPRKPAGNGGRPKRVVKTSSEPLYRQVVQSLRNDIGRGVFPIGSQLPPEDELASRFSVSRQTVREALRLLRNDGLVSSRQGSGTTVMPPSTNATFDVHRVTSVDELIAYSAESLYEIDQMDFVESESIREKTGLQLPAGQRWLRLQGYRHAPDHGAPPFCWTEVLVAPEYAGIQRLVRNHRGPIWRLIEDLHGEHLVEIEQRLRIQTVPAELAQGLKMDEGSPVMDVQRIYHNSAGKIVEISNNLYPSQNFVFQMKLRRT